MTKQIASLKRVILSQPRDIGDVTLTLPMAGEIKKRFPDAYIYFLGKTYTQSIIDAYSPIDEFLNWDQYSALNDQAIISQLQALAVDTIMHFRYHPKIAKLAYSADITNRIGSYTKLGHWQYCNFRVNSSCSVKPLHEMESHSRLLQPLGIVPPTSAEAYIPHYTDFIPKSPLPTDIKNLLDENRLNLIIHPGSNGHGRKWPVDYFRDFIHLLPSEQFNILLTGSPNEGKQFSNNLIAQCPQAHNVMGKMTLAQLLTLIQQSDGLVASSTGPLHLAAALSRKTLGIYPPRYRANPMRWRPIGKNASFLVHHKKSLPCFTCSDSKGCFCMQQVTPRKVADLVCSWEK